MQVTELTWGMLVGAVAVILVIVAVYNAIMSAVKTHREEQRRKREPVEKLKSRANETKEMLKTHDKMLRNEKERIDTLEEQQRIMLRALMAMLSHEINGNSVDKLKSSVAEIQDFLIRK